MGFAAAAAVVVHLWSVWRARAGVGRAAPWVRSWPARLSGEQLQPGDEVGADRGELGPGATARSSFAPVDRGQVLVDVAVMLADGGEAIGDINVLRHQSQIL